jgi:hypothetical protein
MGFHGGKIRLSSPFITYQKKSSGSKAILMYRCTICPVKERVRDLMFKIIRPSLDFMFGGNDDRAMDGHFLGICFWPGVPSPGLRKRAGRTCGFFQPGETTDPRHASWETDLKFGERRGREFEFSLEALRRSERASKFLLDYHVKEFFKQPLPPDWELPE